MLRDDRHELREQVVTGITKLIFGYLGTAAHQQYNPSIDADKSDAEIADAQKKVEGLRKLREEFEDLVTGIIPY